jgi:hypothetical protein
VQFGFICLKAVAWYSAARDLFFSIIGFTPKPFDGFGGPTLNFGVGRPEGRLQMVLSTSQKFESWNSNFWESFNQDPKYNVEFE